MSTEIVNLAECRFEVLTEGEQFIGLGKIWIGETLVRSGRLPLDVKTESFDAYELAALTLEKIQKSSAEVRIRLRGRFEPQNTKKMRDHSFDPIHDTGDWDGARPRSRFGRFDLVLRPAADSFNGVGMEGFSYHWEYSSDDVALYYLLDRASWELDGDIEGATVVNQSDCSDPVVKFAADTSWTTEGVIYWAPECINPCMTHNLPRWVAHQCFDFQSKTSRVLAGVFDRVDLIRSVLRRDKGRAELKTFDKYIFDEARKHKTVAKKILLAKDLETDVQARNVWTWMFEDLHQRARDEFGLKEQPPVPYMGNHYWNNFTIDTYFKDVVPASAAIGLKAIFAENFKKSDYTERQRDGNMCCSHEYEIAPGVGGTAKFKQYIERCKSLGLMNFLWTNTYVSNLASINREHRLESMSSWYMAMEDTRLKYGGAYTSVSSNLDFKNPQAKQMWIDAHLKIVKETGLEGLFVDSHYNLFFMPVSFKGGHPYTVWRKSLGVMKTLADQGVQWSIESFGPFGMNIHGHPASYNPSVAWICYNVGYGNNYVTVPIPGIATNKNDNHDPAAIYYALAHKSPVTVPLFVEGRRIDEVYGPEHRRVLKEYHDNLPEMSRRYLQENNGAVLWHDAAGKRATIFNFTRRKAALPGTVTDLTTGKKLPKAASYLLEPLHTYAVSGVKKLPVEV